jgi:hypothetical protein
MADDSETTANISIVRDHTECTATATTSPQRKQGFGTSIACQGLVDKRILRLNLPVF